MGEMSGELSGYLQQTLLYLWDRKATDFINRYCIVSIHLYSASYSAHQSEALHVRETQREESSLERMKRGT